MDQPDRFTVTNTAGSLGDWLSLTPLLKEMTLAGANPLVIAKDSPHTREYAMLYQGLAEVQFVNHDIPSTPETDERLCFAQRILRRHGFQNVSPIPVVEVTTSEIASARQLLNNALKGHDCGGQFDESDNHPRVVAFNPTVGAARATLPDSHIANYRRLPADLAAALVKDIRGRGITPVWFGTRTTQSHVYQNDAVIEGVVRIPDIPLRLVAACYSLIGSYVGTDTGDHHLMLAAGGVCHTYVPPSTWFYDHGKHLYGMEAWKIEGTPREVYTVFPRAMPTQF